MAIKQLDASKVEAFLYSYEGVPNDDAIPVSGRLSGKNLSVQGEWVERSVAYPSKEKRMERHMVKIEGVLSSTKFQGVIRIEGIAERESVSLKRVRSIWLCNGQ